MSAEHESAPPTRSPPGEHRVVEVARRQIGISTSAADFFALPNACFHQNGPLCRGGSAARYRPTPTAASAQQWRLDGEVSSAPGTRSSSTSRPGSRSPTPTAAAGLSGSAVRDRTLTVTLWAGRGALSPRRPRISPTPTATIIMTATWLQFSRFSEYEDRPETVVEHRELRRRRQQQSRAGVRARIVSLTFPKDLGGAGKGERRQHTPPRPHGARAPPAGVVIAAARRSTQRRSSRPNEASAPTCLRSRIHGRRHGAAASQAPSTLRARARLASTASGRSGEAAPRYRSHADDGQWRRRVEGRLRVQPAPRSRPR